MSEITKTYGDVKVGDRIWLIEGPFASRSKRDDPTVLLVAEVNERNIILENGRKFSRFNGEERGKSANIWLHKPDVRFAHRRTMKRKKTGSMKL